MRLTGRASGALGPTEPPPAAPIAAELADLRDQLADHEAREQLLLQQADFLKGELRELQRNQGRAEMDVMYLKNIVVKCARAACSSPSPSRPQIARSRHRAPDGALHMCRYMETHDLAGLLPVIAETLHLSADEVDRIRQYRRTGGVLGRLLLG